jgi:hypothetical protein
MRQARYVTGGSGPCNYGITGDYDTTSDIDVLGRGIEQETADLVRIARRR